ncbi:MAG: tetratricopeptide repeat protein [Terriglobales bacterium]|jgi:tetratricopeptide (TPR) repeat protein|nr:tetratricopeptide repeat protein [Terriglobales bacterium]
MAFGFGFNKQKVLSAAEKFVQQGKLPNAIAEYEKVLKADPKDLTVMNTVGDLYSRLGNIDKAVDCFKSVGDAYASQGFTVKAIAMYKKLSKIKHSFEGVLRLAELYTQQGLFNDARAQYLQVAEEFLRSGELEQAVRIFQKTLEMDPDNVVMRSKLAEVYVRLGKKAEAWQIFTAAAETLRARGQLEGAEAILQRMLTLDPGNSYALLMRGRTSLDSGDVTGAIEYLEKVADLDTHPEGLTALFNAYLQNGRLPEARVLAGKMLTIHNDPAGVNRYAEALTVSGQFEEALQVYGEYSDSLLSSDPTRILDSLHSIISHVRESVTSLETVLALFTKAGDTTHTTEVYELLAHAYVQSGDLEKAREFYLKLTQLEPQNQLHARNYQQIVGKVGGSTQRFISAEEGSILIEELETTAPFIDQRYEDEIALAVRAALTDAELFISYNMPEKALTPLLTVLPKAPQDLRLNQRLAALHNRAERFAQAAVCCRTLETIYHDAGFPEEATRYGELAARYEERAAGVEGGHAPATVSVETGSPTLTPAGHVEPADSNDANIVESHNVAAASAPSRSGLFFHTPAASKTNVPEHAPEFDIQPAKSAVDGEIDLSGEWDGSAVEKAIPAAAEEPKVEAIPAAVDLPLATAGPEAPVADQAATAEIIEEIRFYLAHSLLDLAQGAFAKFKQMSPEPALVSLIQHEIETATANAASQAEPAAYVSAQETENNAVTGALAESAIEPPHVAVSEDVAPAAAAFDGLVSDLESSLGNEFLTVPPAEPESHEIHATVANHQAETFVEAAPAPPPAHETVFAETTLPAQPAAPEYFEAAGEATNNEASSPNALGSIVSELEASLGDSFLAKKASEAIAAKPEVQAGSALDKSDVSVPHTAAVSAPIAMAAAAPGSSSAAWQHSTAFTNFKPPVPAVQAPHPEETPVARPSADIAAGIDLADMFGELKHELEEDAANTDQDPETHYSLGVAFREMGLLDEAIGELQKVCQTVEHGHPFPQILQTYTWLAQCFLDKGIPEAALRWYERALTLPALDGETRMALHYELACAYETAGNKSSALNHFMEVYGSNIDYRDVAERIKALKS